MLAWERCILAVGTSMSIWKPVRVARGQIVGSRRWAAAANIHLLMSLLCIYWCLLCARSEGLHHLLALLLHMPLCTPIHISSHVLSYILYIYTIYIMYTCGVTVVRVYWHCLLCDLLLLSICKVSTAALSSLFQAHAERHEHIRVSLHRKESGILPM